VGVSTLKVKIKNPTEAKKRIIVIKNAFLFFSASVKIRGFFIC